MSTHPATQRRNDRFAWLVAVLSVGTVAIGLGALLFALRGCNQWIPTRHGRGYSLGTRFFAPSTAESRKWFADAFAALEDHLSSLGFAEDATYVPGTIRDGIHTRDEVEHMYVCSIDSTEVRLFTRCRGGYEVGLDSQLSYVASGTRGEVARTVAKIEQLRTDLTSWIEAYEREHRMPE